MDQKGAEQWLDEWSHNLDQTVCTESAKVLSAYVRQAAKALIVIPFLNVEARTKVAVAMISSLNFASYVSRRAPTVTTTTTVFDLPIWEYQLSNARQSVEDLRELLRSLDADQTKQFTA